MKRELFNVADVEILFEGGWYPYGERNPAAEGQNSSKVGAEIANGVRPVYIEDEDGNAFLVGLVF